MDPDLKAAILDLCELCRETLIGAAETRLIVLCVHQALVNARVPGYLAAHESIGEKAERLEQLKRRLQSSISAVLDKMGDAR